MTFHIGNGWKLIRFLGKFEEYSRICLICLFLFVNIANFIYLRLLKPIRALLPLFLLPVRPILRSIQVYFWTSSQEIPHRQVQRPRRRIWVHPHWNATVRVLLLRDRIFKVLRLNYLPTFSWLLKSSVLSRGSRTRGELNSQLQAWLLQYTHHILSNFFECNFHLWLWSNKLKNLRRRRSYQFQANWYRCWYLEVEPTRRKAMSFSWKIQHRSRLPIQTVSAQLCLQMYRVLSMLNDLYVVTWRQFFLVRTEVAILNCFFELCRLIVLLVKMVKTFFFCSFHLLLLHIVSNVCIFLGEHARRIWIIHVMTLGRPISQFHVGWLIGHKTISSIGVVDPSCHNQYFYIANENPSQ